MKQLKEAKIRKEKRQHFNDWLRARKIEMTSLPTSAGMLARIRNFPAMAAWSVEFDTLNLAARAQKRLRH